MPCLRFNDLPTKSPAVAAEWHLAKNDGLHPSQVAAATHRKVWWLCPKGHEWGGGSQQPDQRRRWLSLLCAGQGDQGGRGSAWPPHIGA